MYVPATPSGPPGLIAWPAGMDHCPRNVASSRQAVTGRAVGEEYGYGHGQRRCQQQT